MTTLILRRQSAQAKLKGSTAEWNDDDYAVLDGEEIIGRIYRLSGGPQNDHWRWALNNVKFYEARRSGIVLGSVAETLEAAKAEIKGEYEAWLAGSRT